MEHDTDNEVYWRPFYGRDEETTVICCQWFDEPDYDHNRYLTTEKFSSEEAAYDWIAENIGQVKRFIRDAKEFGVAIAAAIRRKGGN